MLLEVSHPYAELTEHSRIMFATTFLSGTAAVWWYTIVQANAVPTPWDKFKEMLQKEFIPDDHVRRSRDKLRKLRQIGSVAKYLSDFRNLVLTIPVMTEGERLDRFTEGLKYDVRIEVLKSSVNTFDEATRIALRIDDAVWSASKGRLLKAPPADNKPTPMEIGSVESQNNKKKPGESQRARDQRVNACYVCHKVGCRAWKHQGSANNTEISSGPKDHTIEDQSEMNESAQEN